MAGFDQKVVTFKKMPTLILCCSVDIEADKICQIKKKKEILDSENQKQSLTDAFNKGVLENFAYFTRKYLCWSLFFNKVAGLQLYYRRLEQKCFPVKFVKFLRTPFLTEHLRWLLLENLFRSSRERRLHITGEIYAVI